MPVNSGGATPITVNSPPLIRTRAAEHARVGRELLLPHRAAEHDDGVAAGHLILFGPERASDGRLDAHQREQVAAHQHAHLELGRRLGIGRESGRHIRERGEAVEALGCDRGCPRSRDTKTPGSWRRALRATAVEPTVKTSPGRATGSGRSSSASAKLKIAQLAPMPIASDRTATLVKPGLPASMRQPYRTSCHSRSSPTNPQRAPVRRGGLHDPDLRRPTAPRCSR